MSAKMRTTAKIQRMYVSRTAFSVIFNYGSAPFETKFACLTLRHQRGNCKAKTAYDKGKTEPRPQMTCKKKLLRQGNRRSFAQYARRRRG